MPRLATLGGLALLGDDGPLGGSAARGRNLALLAILARAGATGLTREKLAAYLWPESDAERARHSLDQALYTLRRALGADAFLAGATTLALNHRVVGSDVADFALALEAGTPRRAIDLYAGPFLDGFHLSGAGEFERWVDGERAALHGQYTGALEAVAREAAAGGDHAEAVGFWRRLAAAEPLSSRVALGLMRSLAEAGDRAGALQAAAVHTALVREELGAPPDPSIGELAEELRREAEPDAPGATAPAGAPAHAPAPTAHAPAPIPGGPSPMADAPPAPVGSPLLPTRAPADAPVVPATLTETTARVSQPGWARVSQPGWARVRHAGRARLWVGFAAGAIAVTAAVAFLASRGAPAADERPSVVVAPFENETGDAAFEPVGRMAADWIADGLIRTGLVRVIEDGAGGHAAESIVSGRVYRTGDTLWLQASITRPGSGVVLSAPDAVGVAASRPSQALEPLRQRVLGALGTLYDPRLTAWAEAALRPPSFAAYQEFAAGLELHAVPRDPAGAAERFRRAAELDPDYVLPRLWLAWTAILTEDWTRADSAISALAAYRGRMSPLERAWHDRMAALIAGDNEASYRAARRMVEIAPRSGWVISLANAALDTNRPGEAVSALLDTGIENLGLEREHGWFLLTAAYHQLGDYRRELAVTERAIAADGLNWGFVGPGVPALAALGRFAALERRLDELRGMPAMVDGVPRGPATLLAAVTELRAHGHADEAAALADRVLAREAAAPNGGPVPGAAGTVVPADGAVAVDGSTQSPPARWARLQLLYELGRWDDAERLLRDADAGGPDAFRYRAMEGLLAARRGDTAAARRIADSLAAIGRPFLFGEPTLWRARIEAVLGNDEHAVALLRQAFTEGQGAYAWHLVHVGRDFDTLRGLPTFQALVRPAS